MTNISPEAVEAVAWAIANVIADRRADGVPSINDQRRAEARAAIASLPPREVSERDRSQNFMWGDFWTDKEELDARRRFMLDNGHGLCNIRACNCGSWHGGHASRRLSEISDLLRELDIPTGGVTLLDAVRRALTGEAQ